MAVNQRCLPLVTASLLTLSLEAGAAQDIDAPARVVVLVDSSIAMSRWTNDFRAGLAALVDKLPPEDEISVVSTGGQLRIRVPPTTDRNKVMTAVSGFFPDGGGNTFLDSLLEADLRLLKTAPDKWPVFVILTTDSTRSRQDLDIGLYNRFLVDFLMRGGKAHAVVISDDPAGQVTAMLANLTANTRGSYTSMSLAASLVAKMRDVATFIYLDFQPKVQ